MGYSAYYLEVIDKCGKVKTIRRKAPNIAMAIAMAKALGYEVITKNPFDDK